MFGIFSRGRKSPLEYRPPEPLNVSSLHEAKLAAWAIVIGAYRPSAKPPHARRHRRSMLDDLPAPEPAPRQHRPCLGDIFAAIVRAIGFGSRRPVEAGALSGILSVPVGESTDMTYIGGSDADESNRAPANAAHATIQSRVA